MFILGTIWLLAEEVLEAVTTSGDIERSLDTLTPDKKKRFIKLVCKVKGIETYSGQKTIRDQASAIREALDGNPVSKEKGSESSSAEKKETVEVKKEPTNTDKK